MKNLWVLPFFFFSLTVQAQRFHTIVFSIKTGEDGLREGNDAWISFVKKDGTLTPEKNFADIGRRKGSFDSHQGYTMGIEIGATIDLRDVARIVIRHDGSPRALNPFDTYDNWDVEAIDIQIKSPDGNRNIYDSRKKTGFLVRFTGDKRTLTIPNTDFLPNAIIADKIQLQPTIAQPEAPKAVQKTNKAVLQPTTAKPEVKPAQQSTKIDLKPTTAKPEAPKPAHNDR